VKTRVFRVVTLILLAVIAAVIVIPVLTKGTPAAVPVGVVGPTSASLRGELLAAARTVGTKVRLVSVPDLAQAKSQLRSGHLTIAVDGSLSIYVDKAISSSDTSSTAALAEAIAQNFGIAEAFRAARLSPSQAATLLQAKPLRIMSLEPAKSAGSISGSARQGASIIGLILIFVMLNQYNTWTLIGVMEEKSSRVVEVLLATVRPLQLLGGKVLGIGVVALAQATLLVGFGFALAAGVGSDVLKGKAPLVLLAAFLWLVLGYAFYCWVYAGAGAMAERQDQVQTLALPLSVPMIVGYIIALTAVSSGNSSMLLTVLAYVPLTAPFDMTALVGLGAVTWWEFAISALICIGSTVAVAHLSARVYRRAVLRTGRRVRWREVMSSA
jgi:ABC-2 type transport system permease protein